MTSLSPAAPAICYHCGESLPDLVTQLTVTIDGRERPMCCIGCQAVATAIVDGGLENFYRYRTEVNVRGQSPADDWTLYDLPEIQADFVVELEDGQRQVNLLLEDISCAACGWLIETHLKQSLAVSSASINITDHRCTLVWQPEQQPLSEVMASLAHIGYRPRPATDEQRRQLTQKENRMALFRLGVAGFGMMQATMMAVGMYTGANDAWLDLLRWLGFLAATPVAFFSGWPFFKAAWQSLRARHLVMDVPVALAISLAYIASAWATIFRSGEVYFESISMFVFFLLLGRYVEMRARHRNRDAYGNLAQLMPLSVCRLSDQEPPQEEQLPVKLLRENDRILVRAGEVFAADGVVLEGQSRVVEALLTGEPHPVAKAPGDKVVAGTLNNDSSLQVQVTAIGAATQLSTIEHLAAQAASDKPTQVTSADRIARFFIARLLLICFCVMAFWLWYEPQRAIWVTLSVLVVTCPCALALAMPAALSASTTYLRQCGLLVTRGHVIETLTNIQRVIFDKTGTLTRGEVRVQAVHPCTDKSRDDCLALAAALEAHSRHPLASAFRPYGQPTLVVEDQRQFTGAGVEGRLEQELYRLGHSDFVAEIFSPTVSENLAQAPDHNQQWLLLGNTQGPVCWFALADPVREGASELVAQIQADGLAVELLSGDRSGAVSQLAAQLNITEYTAGALPEDKLQRLRAAQERGEKVLMLGDGINDIPVLAGADVSIAMASASDLAQIRADALLLNEHIDVVHHAIVHARRTRRIIRQNLAYALTYNVLAIPVAAAGWVAPWQAAIGMTVSSLVVVFNSLRLGKKAPVKT